MHENELDDLKDKKSVKKDESDTKKGLKNYVISGIINTISKAIKV